MRYADALIRRAALAPQVLKRNWKDNVKHHFVRWTPFTAAAEVKATHLKIAAMCPPDLVVVRRKVDEARGGNTGERAGVVRVAARNSRRTP